MGMTGVSEVVCLRIWLNLVLNQTWFNSNRMKCKIGMYTYIKYVIGK
jgi:hypothetical protein